MTKFLRPIGLVLAVSVLIMLGATTGGAFAHEIQHAAHHTAGMHGTGICAWMCASAGAVTTGGIQPLTLTLLQNVAFTVPLAPPACETTDQLHARAPPVLL
ncbi:MAG: hypothetical protein E6K60_12030 [Nitrospirae bacterium]|nr:MAG: hypothetical protein E6K60_12030 [Nitrospirota bacterium]